MPGLAAPVEKRQNGERTGVIKTFDLKAGEEECESKGANRGSANRRRRTDEECEEARGANGRCLSDRVSQCVWVAVKEPADTDYYLATRRTELRQEIHMESRIESV